MIKKVYSVWLVFLFHILFTFGVILSLCPVQKYDYNEKWNCTYNCDHVWNLGINVGILIGCILSNSWL